MRQNSSHAALLALLFVLQASPARAITRCEVIAHAQSWVDAQVPYSQSNWFSNAFGSYRQDCSGYVSMAWALPSSYVTSTLPQVSAQLGSFNDLEPGDAVNRTCCHVILFKEWVVPGVSFKAYAEADYGTVAQIQTWTVSYAQSNGYAPYRLNGITGCCTPHCNGSKIVGADCGEGDCGVYGASCVEDALGVRCVSVFCPALGQKKVCVSDSLIGDCNDGGISTGDCGAYGAYCSTAGVSEARCVSVFCVASPKDVPVEHDVCLPDGRIAHCTAAGGITDAKGCPTGQSCGKVGSNAACSAPVQPTPPVPSPSQPGPDSGAAPAPEVPSAGSGAGVSPQPPSSAGLTGAERAPLEGGCSVALRAPASSGPRTLVLLALTGLAGLASLRSRRTRSRRR
jgi:hypothetical protein